MSLLLAFFNVLLHFIFHLPFWYNQQELRCSDVCILEEIANKKAVNRHRGQKLKGALVAWIHL